MGLDTTHDCWHGAYYAFNRFRNELAKAAGYELVETEIGEHADLPWERFELKNYEGEWDTPPDDPLLILLVHSDCEYRIPAEYCEHIANRIERLIPLLPLEGVGHLAHPQEKATQFVEGLRRAAAAGEDVEFQ